MSTPAESATLILKLYDQRREEVMRKARDFFVTFDPKSVEELMAVMMAPEGAYVRMVISYWDMAASLVLNGAIDSKMFQDANGEYIGVFAKMEPFLPAMRAAMPGSKFLENLEKFTLSIPDARARVDGVREFFKKINAMRAGAAKQA